MKNPVIVRALQPYHNHEVGPPPFVYRYTVSCPRCGINDIEVDGWWHYPASCPDCHSTEVSVHNRGVSREPSERWVKP